MNVPPEAAPRAASPGGGERRTATASPPSGGRAAGWAALRRSMRGCATFLLLACAAASAQDTYSLDGTHTTPMYEIRHMGMSIQRGWFTDVQGRVTLDRAAKKGTIEVVIGTASVMTSSRILNDVLKRSDYFNVEQHPAMRYTSSDVVFDGDVPVSANGQLTLLGVTKPVTLAITDFHCGRHLLLRRPMCAAEARATIRRSEFGMTGGLPNVAGDEVRIVIPVEAVTE